MFFSIVSFSVIIIAIGGLISALQVANYPIGSTIKHWWQEAVEAWSAAPKNGWLSKKTIRNLSYFLGLDLVVVLALTGLIQPWLFNQNMSGFLLILHMTAAPFFAISLALVALYWSYAQRYSGEKNRLIMKIKLCFWSVLFLGVLVILSSALSMFPVAGSSAQQVLISLHKYGALLLVVIILMHIYYLTLLKIKPAKKAKSKSIK
ncbi:MAG: hypothetical protein DWQ05_17285 [Calditrichaeota bacterium]|nr:MAG: hypothetical protein DWQ05_17285 [Calditrichota bacterium]